MSLNPLQVKENEKSQSPKGLKVLAIDDNVVCLKILGSILQKCGYTVTTTRNANVALDMLKKNKERFDIVITDVIRDDMDGFKLLEAIGLEMDIPVIMTSANDETKIIVEGIKHGASDYLVKPIKIEDVKNIFQHITTITTSNNTNELGIQESSSSLSKWQLEALKLPLCADFEEGQGHEGLSLVMKRKSQQDKDEETNNDQSSGESCPPRKKNRMRWSKELHSKFLKAYQQLEADNLDKVVPKRILEIMNEPGITREKVASHLQKFRNGLKKNNGILNQDSTISASCNSPGPCFVPRNQHEQVLFQQNATNFAPITSSYQGIDNLVYRPVLSANAISQPDLNGLQYHHHRSGRKMDDEILNNVPQHHSTLFDESVYICPYSNGPVSMNYVGGAPYYHHQMFGDVSISQQMTPISSTFDSTGLVLSSTHAGVPNFGVGALTNESPINHNSINGHENNFSSLDDDLNTMVQQFQENSAPRL